MIDPYLDGDVRERILEYRVWMVVRVWIELENVTGEPVARLLSLGLRHKGVGHRIDQLRSIALSLVVFLVGRFRSRVVGLEHQLENVFPGLQLPVVLGRI